MYDYVVESLEDIVNVVDVVIGKLKTSTVLRKEDLEVSAFSSMNLFCNPIINSSIFKKDVNKVYSNSSKHISKYNAILKEGYSKIIMEGVVFYSNDGEDLNSVSDVPVCMSANNSLNSFNTDSTYNLDIDNYMVLYKLTEGVIGITRFKIKGINYLHCFTVSLEADDTIVSLFLIGNDTEEDALGLNSVLCDRVILCNDSKTVICKKIFKEDTDCMHRKYFNILSLVTKRVMGLCMPDSISEDVSSLVKEAIVLRENAQIVKGEKFAIPPLVIGVDGEVTILGAKDNITQLTRS